MACLFALGIMAARFVADSPFFTNAATLAWLLLHLYLLRLVIARRRTEGKVSFWSASLFCCLLGATSYHSTLRPDDPFPRCGKTEATVRGTIVDPPTSNGRRVRFLLDPDKPGTKQDLPVLHGLVAVAFVGLTRDTVIPVFEYGMRLSLKGLLTRPPEERNPGEFNLRRYYAANGISFQLLVRGVGNSEILDSAGGAWVSRQIVLPLRKLILSHIDRTIGGEEGEFLKGLMVGVRSGIPWETREAFVNSGVAHILAVSGSNVAVVAAALYLFLGAIRFPRLARDLCVVISLLLYMSLTGSQPPVVRATIMALAMFGGRLLERPVNPLNAIGIAGLLLLLLDPRQFYDVGFQLSFVAVLSIIILYPRADRLISVLPLRGMIGRWTRHLLRISALSLVATLGTLPLTAAYFGRVSVIGLLANILVVPAAGISVILGMVSLVVSPVNAFVSEAYATANWAVLHGTIQVTKAAGSSPVAVLQTPSWEVIHSLPYILAVLLVFHLTSGAFARRIFLLLLVSLNGVTFIPILLQSEPKPGLLRVTVIDVGQGDAILVEFPEGATMMIDSGPKTPGYDAGDRVVIPLLRRKGIGSIDHLFLTHPHIDHVGGAAILLASLNVAETYGSASAPPAEHHVGGRRFRPLSRGAILTPAGNVRLYVLSPRRPDGGGMPGRAQRGLNDASLVIKLQYGSVSFLFPGDAERPVERQLIEAYGDFLNSTVLKVSHHGGKTSSTMEFLRAVSPRYSVISVGLSNRFGHPSSLVLERFRELGIAGARTDCDGAVVYETDGFTVSEVAWR